MSAWRRRGSQPSAACQQLRAGGSHPPHQISQQEGQGPRAAPPALAEPLHERVRSRARAWAGAGASSEVISWLLDGYRLPWARAPPRPFNLGVSCRKADAEQRAWLVEEVARLQNIGAIRPATTFKYVSKAFLVRKPTAVGRPRKWRLIIDLRPINRHLRALSCRYETLRRLCTMAREGDWMVSLDLEDGFYAIGVAEPDQKFLTFTLDGLGSFSSTALPMGLSASSYAFTKVVRTFVRALRSPLAPTTVPAAPAMSARTYRTFS